MTQNSAARSTKNTGRWMFVCAWLILAALLYLYFDDKLERQFNPNRAIGENSVSQNSTASITLKQNRQGHYVTSALINQQPVVMLLDTGATEISVPAKVAQRLGLTGGRPARVNTANGTITVYKTKIETLSIGGLTMYDLSAHINPSMDGNTILLGMNALKQLELIQRDNTLTLRKY